MQCSKKGPLLRSTSTPVHDNVPHALKTPLEISYPLHPFPILSHTRMKLNPNPCTLSILHILSVLSKAIETPILSDHVIQTQTINHYLSKATDNKGPIGALGHGYRCLTHFGRKMFTCQGSVEVRLVARRPLTSHAPSFLASPLYHDSQL